MRGHKNWLRTAPVRKTWQLVKAKDLETVALGEDAKGKATRRLVVVKSIDAYVETLRAAAS